MLNAIYTGFGFGFGVYFGLITAFFVFIALWCLLDIALTQKGH